MNKPHGIFFIPPIDSYWLGHQFSEIYKDRVYDPFLRGKTNAVILDIGANIGNFAYYASQFGKVYSVEPSLEHFQVLSHMVEYNELGDKITPVNKALYMQSGQFPLFHNQNKTMFSLHQAVNDQTSNPELVSAITLEDLFKEYGIEHVDLMKLDIEGSEHEILGSESFAKVADKIDTVIIEYHKWSGRHINQLRQSLQERGYTVSMMPSSADIVVGTRK